MNRACSPLALERRRSEVHVVSLSLTSPSAISVALFNIASLSSLSSLDSGERDRTRDRRRRVETNEDGCP